MFSKSISPCLLCFIYYPLELDLSIFLKGYLAMYYRWVERAISWSMARCRASLLEFSIFQSLFLKAAPLIIINIMNKDLLIKYDKDPNFRKQVDENLERYTTMEQAAAYSDLSAIPQGVLKHIKSRNIYFYFGYQQPVSRKYLPKLAMYMTKNFQPQPKQPYTFVFFNELCPDNYVLWNFRQVFATMKLQQVALIEQFIVVKPYFYHKAMDWMTYGTVAKFLKSKTKFIYSYGQLCKHLIVSQQALLDYVPRCLYQKDWPELYRKSLELSPLMQKQSSQSQNWQEKVNQRMKMMKDMVVSSGKQINLIEDYQISQIGVPIIIKMLVFYLQSNQQALQIQGIFRKSVSVDDLSENINNLIVRNYDYLLQIKNPHLIANLIKKFFSSLKIPIIPYHIFHKLMTQKDIALLSATLKQTMKQLPNLNKTTLMFLINFFRQKIIPKEEINKMGVQNLSICFAPCWFRSEQSSSINELMYASKAVMLAKFMIEDFDNIFGSEEEREDLFRKSYYDSKKSFDDELDIGIEVTLKQVEESHPGVMNSRCSSRYSQKYPMQMNQQIFVFASPFHESKIQTVTQRREQSEDDNLLKLMEDSQNQKENPRYSRQVGKDQSDGDFLAMLNTPAQTDNPRYSKQIDLKQEKKEQNSMGKHSQILEDESDYDKKQ